MSETQIAAPSDTVKNAIRSARTRLKGLEQGGDRVVEDLSALMTAIRHIGKANRGGLSAKQAILRHLQGAQGRPVAGADLEVVSGIAEYGRRVRDLRNEGHAIVSGASQLSKAEVRTLRGLGITRTLRPDEYVMLPSRKRAA